MRDLLRNRELRRETALYVILTLLLSAVGLLLNPTAALLTLAAGAAFTVLHLVQARKRYRTMAELSLQLDQILHGADPALISDQSEGELSVLLNEIRKMVNRLNEQSSLLREEKTALMRAVEDMFHQLRTPLTALNIQTALLAEENLSWEDRISVTREARRQLQRMEWLLEALLKMSRMDAGAVTFHKDMVPVWTLVEKAAAPLSIPMELREQILDIQTGEISFRGDLAWSAEALGNLLKNCMEHTPTGGTIQVRAAETALYVELTVQDSGPGFAQEDLPRIFERFYRGKHAGADSVGIGLALARRIAAEQGGTLTADNAPEGGARFVLRFYKSVV